MCNRCNGKKASERGSVHLCNGAWHIRSGGHARACRTTVICVVHLWCYGQCGRCQCHRAFNRWSHGHNIWHRIAHIPLDRGVLHWDWWGKWRGRRSTLRHQHPTNRRRLCRLDRRRNKSAHVSATLRGGYTGGRRRGAHSGDYKTRRCIRSKRGNRHGCEGGEVVRVLGH